jgi:ribonucleoside-diphosphate reductase alpha chain
MMKSYTYDEARAASLSYFDGDELAADVFVSKYALRDSDGNIVESTPVDMHRRLSREFARIEAKYPNPLDEEQIFELLDGFRRIIPQGSPMSGIGNEHQYQSLSNCFIIEAPMDSYGSIARADEEILQIQKRRGGVGVDLSNIRSRTQPVKNAARTADGIPIFMERYSNTTREVAQGGRRGALMETLDVRHPDIELFIDAKMDRKKVTGANVSTRINDEFMEAVVADADFDLRWPVTATPAEATVRRTVRARTVWDLIINAAWRDAEPGVLFWDTVIRDSMADVFAYKGFRTVCTNPCAELPLSPYDSCRLLLINVLNYVVHPFTATASFDFDAFKSDVEKAQRLMDDLVDLELEAIQKILDKVISDPEPESEKSREISLWCKVMNACSSGRRTGTGLTAVGDAVAAMGFRYGDPASIDLVESVYRALAVSAHASSVNMAKERGAFPAWEPKRYKDHPFAERLAAVSSEKTNQDFRKHGRRNIALTTTAPAGSVSVLTRTTSGVEPAYLLHYKRRKKLTQDEIDSGARIDTVDQLGDRWQEYDVFHPGVKQWMDVTGLTDIGLSPYWGATSNDVDWLASVDLLAAAQRWTEHSISKTINLPETATRELVSEVYLRAWKLGIKGVTVYRDKCRDGVLISADAVPSDRRDSVVDHHAPSRPKELQCDVHRASVQGQQYLVLVGLLDGRPYELFAGLQEHVDLPRKVKGGILIKNGKNKDGVATYNLRIPIGDDDSMVFKDVVNLFDNPVHGSFTRTISLALRHGVPVQYLVEQLRKDKNSDITSFSAVIARTLSKNYVQDGTKVTSTKTCGECGSSNLQYQQGCESCAACGSSKCG